jgi:hypothetical protein
MRRQHRLEEGTARPRSLDEPTSSWSLRTIIAMVARSAPRPASAVAAQHDSWLSSRPDASSEWSAPSTAAPCTSYRHSSHHAGVDRRVRRRRRSTRRTRRARAADAPDRGEVLLGVEREAPLLTSRSRWTASCGTRATGSATSTRAGRAAAVDEPAGDAEVAVEPAVVQDAAVDLDGELLPAVAAGVGLGFTRRHGESVWAPTDPERREPVAPSGVATR